MPLDSIPPPSPCGKNPPQPKHICSSTSPCPIHLSDVGKCFHTFPKGTFKARYSPPIVPKYVLNHFAHHAPVWTWVAKDGPNKGKSFQVPTTPVACAKNAPRAVRWMVAVFHSFKAHLNPVAVDADSGRVHQGWLRLYQSNMHLHLQTQIKALQPRCPPIPPNPPNPKPHSPPPAGDPLSELRAEIHTLHEKFYNYIKSHEACCTRSSDQSSDTSSEADPGQGSDPPSPPPPAFTLVETGPDDCEVVMSNPPSWLSTVLKAPDTPQRFKDRHMTMPAPLSTSFPESVLEAKVAFMHFRHMSRDVTGCDIGMSQASVVGKAAKIWSILPRLNGLSNCNSTFKNYLLMQHNKF
ncbi:hypothetical protein EDD15DRAFT_2201225 [Pisolithus albus]|nr:hypothetical protein EDD15DRAFT_2201225 [Pisolithus albus]